MSRRTQSAQKNGVLPLSEFNRIKASLADQGRISNIEEDRRALKDASDNRTKNWSNTVHALRKRKEQEKYEKFEREELERRRIDLEEAQYQAAVKKGVMDKAKRQIFERHDKVKTLHSKMLLSDALQERELQMQINKTKKDIEEEMKKEQHEVILEQCREYDNKEAEKLRELEEKKRHTQEVLKQQHEEFKNKHIVRIMEDRIEGEIIKQKAKEQQRQAQIEEQERRNKIKSAQDETFKSNQILQEIRRKEKEKELLEEAKIEEYKRKREETERKRKEEADRRHKEKQKIRQAMIDRAVSDLKKKQDTENERLNKDIEEARIKAENYEKEKREKIQRLKNTIDHHRDLYMRDKAVRKDKEVQEDKEFQKFWKNKNIAIEENLKQERQNRKTMNKKLSDFQKKQAEQKANEREEDFMREMAEAEAIKTAIENDDKMFMTYAKRCLDEWDSQELKKQKMQNLSTL